MKGTARIKVLEFGTNHVLVSNVFPVSGKTSFLGYGKRIANAIKPYLENETLFDVSVEIGMDDGSVYHHKLSSFKKKGGVVVQDVQPLKEKLFSYKAKPPFVFLELIDPEAGEHGANKWYSLSPAPNNEECIHANFARHGVAAGQRFANHAVKPFQYPVYMYWPKLFEKFAKGYEDHTKERTPQCKESHQVDSNYGIQDTQVLQLVETLVRFANSAIESQYAAPDKVNELAIASARKLLRKLSKAKTVDTFNKHLLELMHTIPRKMYCVKDFFAKDIKDFGKIVSNENDLLDVLENKIAVAKQQNEGKKAESILERLDMEIWPARPDQVKKVEDMLGDNLKGKVKNVYRVINKKTQARFNAYLKKHGYPKVREFWHGSRNANWWNILCQGLLLHSDAPTTGKMFGEGLYFAPSPTKSWGYTSAYGSYWAGGNSHTAFMGIYATAHDNPKEISSYDNAYGSYNAKSFSEENPENDCLYCHGGTGMLRNDECVVYREEQATINFLVEFEA